jgi:hypothetical protein
MRRFVWAAQAAASMIVCVGACEAPEENVEDLGQVTDGRGDLPEIRDRQITLKPRRQSGGPSTRTYSVTSDIDFRVELRYASTAETRITVTSDDFKVVSARGVEPTLEVDALEGAHLYKIKLEHWGSVAVPASLSVLADGAVIPSDVLAAAEANLKRVSKEIDYWHLDEYCSRIRPAAGVRRSRPRRARR